MTMDNETRRIIATLISQRMEMGETDWFFRPAPDIMSSERYPSRRQERAADLSRTRAMDNGGDVAPSTSASQPSGPCHARDFTDSVIARQDTLDTLNATVCGCMRCGLGALRKNFVFGAGNPDADVMFVGEAPGADEDEQGAPFVGRAGRLLTDMIHAIKLSRDEVFIGNILKCRPPQNRDPQAGEIEMCEPILVRQIELIRPKVICALGRISGQTLLKTKASLTSLRGRVHDYHGVKLVVTYHPAALLRNPNWKRPAWEDLKFLRREYDGLEL